MDQNIRVEDVILFHRHLGADCADAGADNPTPRSAQRGNPRDTRAAQGPYKCPFTSTPYAAAWGPARKPALTRLRLPARSDSQTLARALAHALGSRGDWALSLVLAVRGCARLCMRGRGAFGGQSPAMACAARVARTAGRGPGDAPQCRQVRTTFRSLRAVRCAPWPGELDLGRRTHRSCRSARAGCRCQPGAGTAAVAALVAIARIPPRTGLLKPAKQALSLDAATFAGLLWAIAFALPLGFALLPAERVRLDPLMIDYATTSAAIASLFGFRGSELSFACAASPGTRRGRIARPARFRWPSPRSRWPSLRAYSMWHRPIASYRWRSASLLCR